jgi:hypothetical protein
MLPVFSKVEERKLCGPKSLGFEEWVPLVLSLYRKALIVTLMYCFVQQCLWGLLGTKLSGDWKMDKSQQFLHADRITHREFLYDVTDGWIGCHG